MPVDKMSVDKMSVDKMSVNIMPEDETILRQNEDIMLVHKMNRPNDQIK
jgi:hypothetical protein